MKKAWKPLSSLGLACLFILGVANAQEITAPQRYQIKGFVQQTLPVPIEDSVHEGRLEAMPTPGVLGLDLAIRPKDYPVVKQVFAGLPAQQRGILPGDQILSVDGVSTWGESRERVDQQISDVPGTAVRFSIKRNGQVRQVVVTVVALSQAPGHLKPFFSQMLPGEER
jgi:predicted metalloprotease with PDZ domain